MKKLFFTFAILSTLSLSAFAEVSCLVNSQKFSGQSFETADLEVRVTQIRSLTRLEVTDKMTDLKVTTNGDLKNGPVSLNVYRPNGASDAVICVSK